jgi:putative membrane protein
MNQIPENSWSIPQRQAKAGLVIIISKAAVTTLKNLWPILLLLVFKENKKGIDTYEAIAIAIPLIILTRSIIMYYYFRFFIANDELIIRKGFISKKTLTIPLQKIQAVHIEQNLLHQVAKVAKVKIDTAGTEKTEAVIDALEVKKAEQLKEFLLQEKQPIKDETQAMPPLVEMPIIRLSIGDLLRLGLSANHIQALFVILAFSISMVQNLQEVFGDKVIRIVKDSSSAASVSIASISLAVAFILCISVFVSMMRVALNYFDFQLSESAQGFKVKTGLINTKQNLIPFSKIQYISWDANWIRRKVGLFSMEFHQVMSGGENSHKKQRIKVPLTKLSYIDRLLSHYHSMVQPVAGSGYGIHTAYIFRRTLFVAILPIGLLLAILLPVYHNLWLLLLLGWIPFVAIQAFFFRRNFRLFVSPGALQVNSGVWGRKVEIVQWYKGQQVRLQQSIYQRGKELATLKLSTAGGTITIPYIPLPLAQQLQNYTLYEVERTSKAWM